MAPPIQRMRKLRVVPASPTSPQSKWTSTRGRIVGLRLRRIASSSGTEDQEVDVVSSPPQLYEDDDNCDEHEIHTV